MACFYQARKQNNNSNTFRETSICLACISYLYSCELMSEKRICDTLNISNLFIDKALNEFNIPKRTRSQAAKNRPKECNELHVKAMAKRNSELLSDKNSEWFKNRSNKISKSSKKHRASLTPDEKQARFKKGVETRMNNNSYHRTTESINKGIKTKRNNGSFNTSIGESELGLLLSSVTYKYDLFSEYIDDRYPFRCDFYIKSLDLFIEYQGHFTHGNMPYDKFNAQCECEKARLINKIEELDSDMYRKYLEIWTIKDPIKLKTILNNKLNALLIYPQNKNELLIVQCFNGVTTYIYKDKKEYYQELENKIFKRLD